MHICGNLKSVRDPRGQPSRYRRWGRRRSGGSNRLVIQRYPKHGCQSLISLSRMGF